MMAKMADIDLNMRDPNGINDHVKVSFDEVLAEPDGAHSLDCVWKVSNSCYSCCNTCCYSLMTLLCALPASVLWGCEFALLAFSHVWCYTPALRVFVINMGHLQKVYGAIVQCWLQPCCEACSHCFGNIRVHK